MSEQYHQIASIRLMQLPDPKFLIWNTDLGILDSGLDSPAKILLLFQTYIIHDILFWY